jgi:thymidylate kinase
MLVVLEGIGGVGKTTVCKLLRERHPDWYFSTEPCQKTFFGKLARAGIDGDINAFGDHRSFKIAKDGMLHLMDLARYEHLAMIEERLVSDLSDWDRAVVVLDRYTGSTLIYQQERWSMGTLLDLCGRHRIPDLGILLDCEEDTAVSRLDPGDDYDRDNVAQRRLRYLDLWKGLSTAGQLCGKSRAVISVDGKDPDQVSRLVELCIKGAQRG